MAQRGGGGIAGTEIPWWIVGVAILIVFLIFCYSIAGNEINNFFRIIVNQTK